MMAALVILALALTLCRLAIDGISIRWRLRGAAHEVESVAQWALNASASRNVPTQVLYDIQDNCWWVQMEKESYARHQLPPGVEFVSVRFADGTRAHRRTARAVVRPADGRDELRGEDRRCGRALGRTRRVAGPRAGGAASRWWRWPPPWRSWAA
jgi:hypothetical protein